MVPVVRVHTHVANRHATLYCCFVDFKKAFDTVPRAGLWQQMRELGVPNDLCMGIYRIYQRVLCRLKGCNGISQVFESNMGVKQGCPLSPTLFGLCISNLEEILHMGMKKNPNAHELVCLSSCYFSM